MNDRKVVIDISSQVIFKIAIIAIAFLFFYLIGHVLLGLFIAAVIASALEPIVDSWQRRGIPRWLSTIIFVVLFLAILGFVGWQIVPPIVSQLQELATNLPRFYERFTEGLGVVQDNALTENLRLAIQGLSSQLAGGVSGIYSAIATTIGGFVTFITIVVLSFYLIAQERGVKKFVMVLTPAKYQPYISELVTRLQEKMGSWLRGQLLLMLIIGVLDYIGLSVMGVRYALVLAILGGLFEIIPYIGIIIAIVPAVIVAFVQSPILALFVIILYTVIQQLENHLLVPKVMQKSVGLNPILVILALLIGGKLGGVLGMIVAVPAATAITVIASDFRRRGDEKNVEDGLQAQKTKNNS